MTPKNAALQYDDAVFGMLLSQSLEEFATAESGTILDEYEEGEAFPVSANFEKRIQKIVAHARRPHKRRVRAKVLAVCAATLVLTFVFLTLSVSAFRTSVLNFVLGLNDPTHVRVTPVGETTQYEELLGQLDSYWSGIYYPTSLLVAGILPKIVINSQVSIDFTYDLGEDTIHFYQSYVTGVGFIDNENGYFDVLLINGSAAYGNVSEDGCALMTYLDGYSIVVNTTLNRDDTISFVESLVFLKR